MCINIYSGKIKRITKEAKISKHFKKDFHKLNINLSL